jgi:predicted DNA-binding transcriptional regulator AlpA
MTSKSSLTPTTLSASTPTAISLELRLFDELPDSAHVPIDTVCGLYCCSNATIWRRVRSGEIITPVRFGSRTTRWNVGDLRRALSKENPLGASLKQNKLSAAVPTTKPEMVKLLTQSESPTSMGWTAAGPFHLLAGHSGSAKSKCARLVEKLVCGGNHVVAK